MAKVAVALLQVSALAASGPGGVPVPNGSPIGRELLQPAGSNARTTLACASIGGDGGKRQIWEVTPLDCNAWIRIASGTPTASEGNDYYCPQGVTRWFGATAGDVVAALNV